MLLSPPWDSWIGMKQLMVLWCLTSPQDSRMEKCKVTSRQAPATASQGLRYLFTNRCKLTCGDTVSMLVQECQWQCGFSGLDSQDSAVDLSLVSAYIAHHNTYLLALYGYCILTLLQYCSPIWLLCPLSLLQSRHNTAGRKSHVIKESQNGHVSTTKKAVGPPPPDPRINELEKEVCVYANVGAQLLKLILCLSVCVCTGKETTCRKSRSR